MIGFRILLAMMITGVLCYTGLVGLSHGWDFFPVFLRDMAAISWPGQFDFDFFCFLTLCGIWVAWRHQYSPGGLVLGLVAVLGGILFLAPYLLMAHVRAKGNMQEVLLGKSRVNLQS